MALEITCKKLTAQTIYGNVFHATSLADAAKCEVSAEIHRRHELFTDVIDLRKIVFANNAMVIRTSTDN